MRNPNRIKPFCDRIAELWEQNVPDWRFGQLCDNIFRDIAMTGRDHFFFEDEVMLDVIEQYFKKIEQYFKSDEEI